jgi:integron integrase
MSLAPTIRPDLVEKLRRTVRERSYSRRTEETYVTWVRRYVSFCAGRDPALLDGEQVARFLSHLATTRGVSASTQSQAFSALSFLYREVLGITLARVQEVARCSTPPRLPVVLARADVFAVLEDLQGTPRLVAGLLYGAGLRLREALDLRVKDLDVESGTVSVGRGGLRSHRVAPLPPALRASLAGHLARVCEQHRRDLESGLGRVPLPGNLDRQFPRAGLEWSWQFVFPAARMSVDPATGSIHRGRMDDTVIERALAAAARRVGIERRVTCHMLRQSCAAHLLEDGRDARQVQALLGHASLATTRLHMEAQD